MAIGAKEEKRNFYRTVLALVVPMAVQNLINVGVQAADVVMLGRVGETAISAASLAGQVYFVMSLFFFGLTSGAAVLTAQYWGKGDIKTIEKVLALALKIGVAVSAVFCAAALCFPRALMSLFSNEEEVIAEGIKYMRIVAAAYIPSAITMVYLNVIRSVERVVVSTVVYTVSLCVNVVLNAVLIFGLCGAPALGVSGAAIATAIARYTETAIVLFYAVKMNDTVRVRAKNFFGTDKLLVQDFTKYALPVTVNEVLWGSGISVISAIIGHLGKAAVAANSVAYVVRQLAMVATFGIANATAIMLGKVIGEGKTDLARTYSVRFIKITAVLGLCGAALILAITPAIVHIMALGAEAGGYLRGMLAVMAYFVIFSGFNTVLIVGVFRAGGDTKFGLIIDSGVLWGGAILFGAIAAFWWKLPVMAVYVILTADEIVKAPISFWRYRSYKWLRNVTRDFD